MHNRHKRQTRLSRMIARCDEGSEHMKELKENLAEKWAVKNEDRSTLSLFFTAHFSANFYFPRPAFATPKMKFEDLTPACASQHNAFPFFACYEVHQ